MSLGVLLLRLLLLLLLLLVPLLVFIIATTMTKEVLSWTTVMNMIATCYHYSCQEVCDYLMARLSEPWMHDLMVALDELDGDIVNRHRKLARASMSASIEPIDVDGSPAVAADSRVVPPKASGTACVEERSKAIKWMTNVKDDAVLQSLMATLPEAVQEDIQVNFKNRSYLQIDAVASKGPMKWPGTNLSLRISSVGASTRI